MGPWWVASRIDATVTRQFVVKHLVADEVARLDRPVAFGAEDLTERTYWDSIQARVKRIFLILVDIGVPDQIFGIVDDGWDDSELPLSMEDVERLQLTAVKDDRIDRKFYQRQFQYILKTIDRGEHRAFSDSELVPLDVVDRSPPLTSKSNQVDKVRLPNVPNRLFTRRRYALGRGTGSMTSNEFLELVNAIKTLQSDHIVSYWGSYTHQNSGYILLTPISEYNLKSFLSTVPSSFKSLPKKTRRETVMNWILCLVDAMCLLHSRNRAHSYIKPSAILFTNQHQVFMVDPTRLSPEAAPSQAEKTSFDREWYDYAAPEQWFRPSGPGSPPTRQAVLASLSVSPENNLHQARGYDEPAPNPQLDVQQADIFSMGCIILELLSYLVKRSSSKFASFRSAKHKTAGRGGAVLDSSFHKNLGQVESWMSTLAKEAASKVSNTDGANVFRGFTPILHVVTGMLSAHPYERPPAVEVQQRIYRILREDCGIEQPHCTHQYSVDLPYQLGRMRLGNGPVYSQPIPIHPQNYQMQYAMGYNSPPALLDRRDSSSGYSEASRRSSNTTGSSERDGELAYAAVRGMPSPQPMRVPIGWARGPPQMGPPNNQASMYAVAP
jgi:serine/threonine protein kinase